MARARNRTPSMTDERPPHSSTHGSCHDIHGRKTVALQLLCIYSVIMTSLQFEWDEWKNRTNQRKHGISFEEAQTVFFDENAFEYFDPDHSEEEDRFLMLGISAHLRVLVVCHCLREAGNVIRIISARKATRKERSQYRRGER